MTLRPRGKGFPEPIFSVVFVFGGEGGDLPCILSICIS